VGQPLVRLVIVWIALVGAALTPGAMAQDLPPTSGEGEEQFGGTSIDRVLDVESDPAGDLTLLGVTYSSDFPQSDGLGLEWAGTGEQGFLRKYSAEGDLIFSTLLPGELSFPTGLAIGPDGSAHIVGSVYPGDGSTRGAVVKLGPDGSAVDYFSQFGGSGSTQLNGIAIDGSGRAFVVGYADDSFPVPPSGWQRSAGRYGSGLVARLSSAGDLDAATFVPATVEGVNVDDRGDVYVVGAAVRGAFGSVPGAATNQEMPGESDGLIARVAPGLDQIRFASTLGGRGGEMREAFHSVVIEQNGTVHAVGRTDGSQLEQIEPLDPHAALGVLEDALYASVSHNGTEINQLAALGGSDQDFATDIELAADGAVVFSGETGASDFPYHGSVTSQSFPAFAVRVDDGALTHSTVVSSQDVGGSGGGLAATPDGLVHVAGMTVKPSQSVFPDIDGHLASLKLNPYVDEPAVVLRRRQPFSGRVTARAGASERVALQAWGKARARLRGGTETIRFRAAKSAAPAYSRTALKLKPSGKVARRLYSMARRAGKDLRVVTKTRFEDADGAVAFRRSEAVLDGRDRRTQAR
jgi:hypothetical protein